MLDTELGPVTIDVDVAHAPVTAGAAEEHRRRPDVNLVVPVRYTHSHNGIMNRRDFDQMVELLVALLQKLDAPTGARVRDFTP